MNQVRRHAERDEQPERQQQTSHHPRGCEILRPGPSRSTLEPGWRACTGGWGNNTITDLATLSLADMKQVIKPNTLNHAVGCLVM